MDEKKSKREFNKKKKNQRWNFKKRKRKERLT